MLAGCSPSSIGTNETREEPVGAVQATNSRGAPRVSAAWISPDTIAVTTWGSSSCATRSVRIERTGAHEVEVRVRRTDGRDGCTADASPTTNEVVLPDGVSTGGPLAVVVDDGGEISPRLTLQPPQDERD
jgi:hypothetical protein